jgi:8-oxo-dGTP pyrophosphatase MutT (NUDIX family)
MDTLLQRLTSAVAAEGTQSSDFDLNPDTVLPADRTLRAAGVLVGVMDGSDGPSVLLTKRSSKLKHHPGQIAFPGGKVEPDDLGPVQAALREAHEEVGLPPENVRVIGTMPTHETVTRFTVTPVLALIETDFTPKPEVGEVDEVFTVPLSHVTNPDRFSVEGRHWRGTRRHYFTVPYGPYYIWGATARILRGLADRWSQ